MDLLFNESQFFSFHPFSHSFIQFFSCKFDYTNEMKDFCPICFLHKSVAKKIEKFQHNFVRYFSRFFFKKIFLPKINPFSCKTPFTKPHLPKKNSLRKIFFRSKLFLDNILLLAYCRFSLRERILGHWIINPCRFSTCP